MLQKVCHKLDFVIKMYSRDTFNTAFYKLHNDLQTFSDDDAYTHYITFGVSEKRRVLDMQRPLLEVFTTTFQEPEVLLELIQFYRKRVPSCLITVQDNESTDVRMKEISETHGCKFTTFSTGGKMDENTLMKLRNNSWKASDAIYVLVVDSDELVDIDESTLRTNLLKFEWYAIKCKGYELFGNDENDFYFGTPSEGYSKQVLFIKDLVKETNYGPGSHVSNFICYHAHKLKVSNTFNLYHTKWQNWARGLERQAVIATRRSSNDIQNGWNFHYSLPESSHKNYYDNGVLNSVNICKKQI